MPETPNNSDLCVYILCEGYQASDTSEGLMMNATQSCQPWPFKTMMKDFFFEKHGKTRPIRLKPSAPVTNHGQ